jgi:hypothetical protein
MVVSPQATQLIVDEPYIGCSSGEKATGGSSQAPLMNAAEH